MSKHLLDPDPADTGQERRVWFPQWRLPRRHLGRVAWRYAAGETAIVTLGILLAFALSSWHEQRQRTARERTHLIALQSDLEATLVRIESTLRTYDRILFSARSLLGFSSLHTLTLSADSVEAQLTDLASLNSFHPVTAAYEELISSDGLGALSSAEIRNGLSALINRFDRFGPIQEWGDELWFGSPVLGEDLEFLLMLPPDLREREGLRTAEHRPDYSRLLQDRRFRNFVALRWRVIWGARENLRAAGQDAERLRQLISRELGHF